MSIFREGWNWISFEAAKADGASKVMKDRIMRYYIAINQKYGIGTEEGLKTYIHDMLEKAS